MSTPKEFAAPWSPEGSIRRHPIEVFAERVAQKWFREVGVTPKTHDGLASLVASELRNGGWERKSES